MHFCRSSLIALAVAVIPLSQAAWTVSDLHCHDSDCAGGAILFGFKFDNGAGTVTNCGGSWSVWTPPNDWNKCEAEGVEWKFTAGEKFPGCNAFELDIRQPGAKQQKRIGVSEKQDPDYQCSGLVNPCPPGWCQQCTNNECNNFSLANFEPDSYANNAAGYRPGWCGIHVTQHQKPDPSKDNYKLDITIFDANQKEIGKVTGADAPSGKPVEVTSKLPLVLLVKAGNVDADPVWFDYGDQHFGSNDQPHHCNFGQYDSGKREGDCGFTCA